LAGLVERLTDEPAAGELVDERRARLSGRAASRRKEWSDAARSATATGAVPKERLVAELGVALEGEDWVLAAGSVERVEHKLWDLERPHQWCGHSAGGGLGYNAAAAIGVGLAVPTGTIVIDVQGDGDLLFAPQALWTAANLRSPVLIVVHNNRAYGNTVGHAHAVAAIRDRAPGYEHVGSRLADPPVDFAALARSFGVAAWGPVSTVETLQSALAEALATVREGGPALVDVLTPAHAGPDTTEEP
jgi:thiamine pyrophosphate-dependent acetolactate synthase large subunit-like protein